MRKKFFTIVTSVLNGEKFIGDLINSIRNQTFKNYEYIVVDGGSTDQTRKILKKNSKFIDKIIFKSDNSMYEGISTGFNNGSGKYFLWLNSDDFLINNFSLANLYKYLRKENDDWVTCRTAFFDQKLKKIKEFIPLFYPQHFISKGFCHSGSWGFIQQENTIFKSSLYKKVGGIDREYKQAADFFLWKKFAKYSKLNSINISFAAQRIWSGQLTKKNKNTYFNEIKVKKRKNYIYFLRIFVSIILFFFYIKFKR